MYVVTYDLNTDWSAVPRLVGICCEWSQPMFHYGNVSRGWVWLGMWPEQRPTSGGRRGGGNGRRGGLDGGIGFSYCGSSCVV